MERFENQIFVRYILRISNFQMEVALLNQGEMCIIDSFTKMK